jgi:hypothetical protein
MFQRPLRVCFGEFEMDEHAGELRKEGIKVRLQEQPLQILQVLLERPGEVVTRKDLRKRVWPTDTFVDFDHGINNAIKRLREAVEDTANTPASLRRCLAGDTVSSVMSKSLRKQTLIEFNHLQFFPSKICRGIRNRNISPMD